ncbi:MAG TPA: NAD(P)H-dependent oxidoreductase [Usitatibacter sp.]|jgi:chromate reductase|nr:NAD(P)H-dependent oxidoreductase [Usitatibacter sp.]
MSAPYRVAMIVGSLRRGSFNRMMGSAAREVAPANVELVEVAIGELPLYNQDLETDAPPAPWKRFRDEMRTCQAVLFVTPEYNRSIPGALKNAIDVGSRPYGQSVWSGKPAAIISVSPGALGAFGANQDLRHCFVFLDMPVLQQPEAYIGGAAKLFDEQGRMANDDTREFIRKFMAAFAQWIETTRKR